MKQHTYNVTSSVVFGLVALMHLIRLILQWSLTISGHVIGMWVSIVAFIIAGLLSYFAGRLASKE